MKIKCYKCGKAIECFPQGECWCKNLKYKISKRKIEKKKNCMCEDCLKKIK